MKLVKFIISKRVMDTSSAMWAGQITAIAQLGQRPLFKDQTLASVCCPESVSVDRLKAELSKLIDAGHRDLHISAPATLEIDDTYIAPEYRA